MPSVVFDLLIGMFDRVTNAVKGIFGKKKKAVQQPPPGQSNNSKRAKPPTPAQRAAEAQRQRVNAEQFVSNGILIETVSREEEEEDHSEAWILDVEAGTEAVLPTHHHHNNKATTTTTTTSHPYSDPNRMTTVLEPLM